MVHELITENPMLSFIVATLMGTILRSLVDEVLSRVRKGEQKTIDDEIEAVLERKNYLPRADHEHCRNINTGEAIKELSTTIDKKIGDAIDEKLVNINLVLKDIKEWMNKFDDRVFALQKVVK